MNKSDFYFPIRRGTAIPRRKKNGDNNGATALSYLPSAVLRVRLCGGCKLLNALTCFSRLWKRRAICCFSLESIKVLWIARSNASVLGQPRAGAFFCTNPWDHNDLATFDRGAISRNAHSRVANSLIYFLFLVSIHSWRAGLETETSGKFFRTIERWIIFMNFVWFIQSCVFKKIINYTFFAGNCYFFTFSWRTCIFCISEIIYKNKKLICHFAKQFRFEN